MLFADEVYRYLEYQEEDRLPWACDLYEDAVSLGVMSKSFGLPGLRIGWITTRNRSIMNKMSAFKDYTSICNSAPSEFLATIALRHYQQIAARNLQIIRENLDYIKPFLNEHRELLTWTAPKAGPIAFPRLNTDVSMEEIARSLMADRGVLILPGVCYGTDQSYFRLGFGRRNFKSGWDEFQKYIESNIFANFVGK